MAKSTMISKSGVPMSEHDLQLASPASMVAANP